MNALREDALAHAQRGDLVLPLWWTDEDGICQCPKGANCPSLGKHPLTKHGLDDASSDSTTIEQWWTQYPLANIGVRTDREPRIDIDLLDVAEQLAQDTALPLTTEVVRTPSGGLHVGLAAETPVESRTLYLDDGRKLGELKAARAYVVVPPSAIGGNKYLSLSPEAVGPLPVDDPLEWLAQMLPAFGFTLALRQPNGQKDYRALAGTVSEGQGRHIALTSYAGRIWIEGMSSDTFFALLRVMNERQCHPPLPDHELQQIAKHFVERCEPGKAPAPDPEVAVEDTPFTAECLADLLQGEDEPLDAVITDGGDGAILTADGKGCVAAPTGIGKTNVLLRGSRSLCEASPFLGYPVPVPRRVLYLALEGSPRAYRRRLKKIWNGADEAAVRRFRVAHIALNLAEESDLDRLDQLLYSVQPEILIIDPLRNAHPWDENVSHEVARLTRILDGIITRHQCAIIFAHHDRKRPPFTRHDVGTNRVRGSTALTGWLSFCLSMDREPGNVKDRFVFAWTKTRDAENPLPPFVADFDRENLDFDIRDDAAVGGKVSDEAILTAVYQSGGAIKGTDLIPGFVGGAGASDRWVRERIRALVKAGRLISYVAPEDRKTNAKSYRLADEEPMEMEL